MQILKDIGDFDRSFNGDYHGDIDSSNDIGHYDDIDAYDDGHKPDFDLDEHFEKDRELGVSLAQIDDEHEGREELLYGTDDNLEAAADLLLEAGNKKQSTLERKEASAGRAFPKDLIFDKKTFPTEVELLKVKSILPFSLIDCHELTGVGKKRRSLRLYRLIKKIAAAEKDSNEWNSYIKWLARTLKKLEPIDDVTQKAIQANLGYKALSPKDAIDSLAKIDYPKLAESLDGIIESNLGLVGKIVHKRAWSLNRDIRDEMIDDLKVTTAMAIPFMYEFKPKALYSTYSWRILMNDLSRVLEKRAKAIQTIQKGLDTPKNSRSYIDAMNAALTGNANSAQTLNPSIASFPTMHISPMERAEDMQDIEKCRVLLRKALAKLSPFYEKLIYIRYLSGEDPKPKKLSEEVFTDKTPHEIKANTLHARQRLKQVLKKIASDQEKELMLRYFGNLLL